MYKPAAALTLLVFEITFAISVLCFGLAFGQAVSSTARETSRANLPSDSAIQERANALLSQMTLEEKVAQLSQLPGFALPEFSSTVNKTPEELIRQVGAGSVLWVSDSKEINRLLAAHARDDAVVAS